ncbi:MAG: NAD(P)H-dependent oxidoreductase [Hyphomonas sp.]|nr:NAD(P)H-dependent oxidoreductase [Hyphomonas sp.]
MTRRICIIDGHPDSAPDHLVHALCDAYAKGAGAAGHAVSRIRVADLDIPFLTSQQEFDTPPSEPVLSEREKMAEADHVFIAFPLWLGGMPARLRAFFEQAGRGGFFVKPGESDHEWPERMMKGKSSRIVMTMGMPGLVYRFGMDAGALKALERGVLGLSGFKPMHHTIIGGVGALTPSKIESWLDFMEEIGRDAV